jgi:hypothetical protein
MLPPVLVVLLLLGGVWLVCQPRYVFVVSIKGGLPRVTQGKVTGAFLHQVREVCQRNGVEQGWLGGVQRGQRTALVFSRHFPPGCRQQLRNGWLLAD